MKMNILSRLAFKNLKLNKKRTVVTLIGIILAVALICSVTGMAASGRQTLIESAKAGNGEWHFEVQSYAADKLETLRQNRDFKDVKMIYNVGIAILPYEKDVNSAIIMSKGDTKLSDLHFEALEGRLPEKSGEIAVNNALRKELDIKVGETVTLNVADLVPWADGESAPPSVPKTYSVVGVIKNDTNDLYQYAVTAGETSENIEAYVTLKNPTNYKRDIPEAFGFANFDDYYAARRGSSPDSDKSEVKMGDGAIVLNNELLRWEAFSFSDEFIAMFLAVIAVVASIIMLTSVFCIRNSFAISTTEKMKMYGMLASVGATKKQIKKSVFFEAFLMCAVGIPLGILLGVFAVFVLIKSVNALVGDFVMTDIGGAVFSVSFASIAFAALLGFFTVYFSARSSAKRASRVSPIEQLRGTGEVKINSKKLKNPKIIEKLFGTGGVIAYKNLKRSKRKYRTTVISLTVSIFVFISMYSFIGEAFGKTEFYYQNYDYNIDLRSLYNLDETEIEAICRSSTVDDFLIVYRGNDFLIISDEEKINRDDGHLSDNGMNMGLIALDTADFKEYCQKIGVNYKKARQGGILYDYLTFFNTDKKLEEFRRYDYKSGDVIKCQLSDLSDLTGEAQKKDFEISVAGVTHEKPRGYENYYFEGGIMIVEKAQFENVTKFVPDIMTINSNDATATAELIRSFKENVSISNLEEEVRQTKSFSVLVAIFLYGFITVIILIGVTNIFNTITANMELRQKEFAMLKSIGMTKKEFNRMVNLETLFYSSKSLLYGTVLGLLGAYAVHLAFAEGIQTAFVFPFVPIIISIIFVFVLVFLIMQYSVRKINKQNVIETIRKENI